MRELFKNFINKAPASSKTVAIKIPVTKWRRAKYWGDYHMALLLQLHLEELGYQSIIQILPEWYSKKGMHAGAVIVFRGLSAYKPKPHQINLMWNISHPNDVTLEEYESYDKVFIASEYWAKKVNKITQVPVEPMLQCTDPVRFFPPCKKNTDYNHQLLFVGNSRDQYREILRSIIPTNHSLSVYGKNWEKFISSNYIKGKYIKNDLLYKYYGAADILLNDHWEDMKSKGFISNRIFDGLACGAFIISDKVKEMGKIENYIETYQSADELERKIDFFLNNPVERTSGIADRVSYVRENHTFKHRAAQFVKSIEEMI